VTYFTTDSLPNSRLGVFKIDNSTQKNVHDRRGTISTLPEASHCKMRIAWNDFSARAGKSSSAFAPVGFPVLVAREGLFHEYLFVCSLARELLSRRMRTE